MIAVKNPFYFFSCRYKDTPTEMMTISKLFRNRFLFLNKFYSIYIFLRIYRYLFYANFFIACKLYVTLLQYWLIFIIIRKINDDDGIHVSRWEKRQKETQHGTRILGSKGAFMCRLKKRGYYYCNQDINYSNGKLRRILLIATGNNYKHIWNRRHGLLLIILQ